MKQNPSADETNLCANCFTLMDQMHVITAELKSAQLIISILQEELDSKATEPITSNNLTTCVNSNNWKQVPANKTKTETIKTTTVKQPQPQPIPTIINRYVVLNKLQNHEQKHHPREHDNNNASQKRISRAPNDNKTTLDEKRRKIIIIGDSHARGCAQELQHNLGHGFIVQGIVKPGANLQTIVNAPTKTIAKLTKQDVLVVWGGTRDVGRNETAKGLYQIRNFVDNHRQTNIIVMSVPYRHDLEANSCVNQEVNVYNRKLKKHLKPFDNAWVIDVDTDWDIFTRHGLHLNLKGKEKMANTIVKAIKTMLNKGKSVQTHTKKAEGPKGEKTGTEGEILTTESTSGNKNHPIVLRWKEERAIPRPTADMMEMSHADKDPLKIPDHLPPQKKTVLNPEKRRVEMDELENPPNEQDKSDEMVNLKGSKPKPETKNGQQESERVQNVILDSANDTKTNTLDDTTNKSVIVCENSDMKALDEKLRVSKRKKKTPTTKSTDFLW